MGAEVGLDIASLAPEEIPMGEPEGQSEPPEPEIEPAETTEGESPAEGEQAEAGEATEEPAAAPADINKRVSDFLKGLKDEENAEVVKALRAAYFQHAGYRELYPSVQDAKAFKEQIEAIGGTDAIAELQEVASSVEQTDALLESGDPAVLDMIFSDAKDGAVKLAPHYLNRVAKESPEAFQRTVLPHFVQAIEQSGLPRVLQAIGRMVQDKPEALEAINDVLQWHEGQKRLAEGFKTDTASPERDALKQERETVNRERQQIFMEGIQQDVVSRINQSLSARLKSYESALKQMPERARRDFTTAIYQEIQNLSDADKRFKQSLDSMINSKRRDRNGVVNFIGSKVESVADRIVAKVAAEYGLKKGVAKAAPKAEAPSNGNKTPGGAKGTADRPVKLNGKPNAGQVDWDKTSNVDFLTRRAWLRNGNFVQW